ncbi:hypothetical protein BH18ACT11_BH18ACT11_20780 [soil metagenome]
MVERSRVGVGKGARAEAYLLDGTVARRMGSGHPSMVPYRNFECHDGRFIFIAASNDRLWANLCEALELERLLDDERFEDNLKRGENRVELEEIIAAKVAEYDLDYLREVLQNAGVPAAPVNTIDRLMSEPQVEHRQMIQNTTHSTLGEMQLLGQPMKARRYAAPPTYGEHTDEILRDHGYRDEEVAALREGKVVQ